ncbi:MAG: aminopeptidase P N-terminal domain-containing protein [Salibacteraceae bacterium]
MLLPIGWSFSSFGQEPELNLTQEEAPTVVNDYRYDTDLLSAEFHQQRRQALRDLMPDSSVAVLFANPVRNRSNDVDFEYHQDPNFYYLTGLKEPHSVVVIFKQPIEIDGQSYSELVFVQPRNPRSEVWTGKRMGVAGTEQVLGLEKAYENIDFAHFPIDFGQFSNLYYLTPQNDVRDDGRDLGDLYSMVKHFVRKVDTLPNGIDPRQLSDLMAELREVKTPEEMVLLRKAIDITCEAQQELMANLKPGMPEYEAEAIVEYVFKKNGAEYQGFPSILGGGENSCILHYTTNRKPLIGNNLLVSDIGAEYHGYTADVTRTLPVDGRFSKEEKIIYNIVLAAQAAGLKSAKAGSRVWTPPRVASRIITQGLLENGIIGQSSEVGRYFMHGTSHYLGLDVHDAGLFGPLKPGNVITVEPGIYIPEGSPCDPKWWNIGVRIEDDVLITAKGPEVLSACVPKTVKEIEQLMQQSGKYVVPNPDKSPVLMEPEIPDYPNAPKDKSETPPENALPEESPAPGKEQLESDDPEAEDGEG